MDDIRVSIVIPVFNEEKIIRTIIDELLKFKKHNWQIIVVDDGSTDGTAERIARGDFILLRHETNRGYGAAIKTGILKSSSEIIAIIDADGTYSVADITRLLGFLDNFDMVVGQRKTGVPLLRRPAKWILNQLANYLSGTRIPDLNSGLRIFKKNIALKFFRILPDGFSFTTTITLAMLTNGYNIKYVPIDYRKRIGISKVHPLKDTLGFLQLIIKTILYFNPLKIFFPLSLVLFIASLFVLVFSRVVLGYVMDVTTVILFISGIQILTVGLIADLINKRI